MSSNILYNQQILDNLKYFIDKIRIIRNELLNLTDKYLLSDYPITLENLELVKNYRNELRNYMDGQGVNISTTALNEIADVVGNVLDFSFGIGKIVIIGTLSVVGLVLLSILIKLFKNPKQQLNLNTLPIPSPNKILTK